MRTLYVTEFISLDGVVEAPGGEESYKHTGWTFDIASDPTMYEFKGEETFGTETLLLGRDDLRGLRRGLARARRASSPTSSTPWRRSSSRRR